jgi:hypothetical protein
VSLGVGLARVGVVGLAVGLAQGGRVLHERVRRARVASIGGAEIAGHLSAALADRVERAGRAGVGEVAQIVGGALDAARRRHVRRGALRERLGLPGRVIGHLLRAESARVPGRARRRRGCRRRGALADLVVQVGRGGLIARRRLLEGGGEVGVEVLERVDDGAEVVRDERQVVLQLSAGDVPLVAEVAHFAGQAVVPRVAGRLVGDALGRREVSAIRSALDALASTSPTSIFRSLMCPPPCLTT